MSEVPLHLVSEEEYLDGMTSAAMEIRTHQRRACLVTARRGPQSRIRNRIEGRPKL